MVGKLIALTKFVDRMLREWSSFFDSTIDQYDTQDQLPGYTRNSKKHEQGDKARL